MHRQRTLANAALIEESRQPATTHRAAWEPVEEGVLDLVERFKESAALLDGALANGTPDHVHRLDVAQCFAGLSDTLNAVAGQWRSTTEFVRRELLPYVLLGRASERAYTKPRGYGGDYGTIDLIYRNQPKGAGRLGPAMDSVFLSMPAADAVRNRRHLLATELVETIRAHPDRVVRVTSIGAGPAREVFDVLEDADVAARLHVTLIDADVQALDLVRRRLAATGRAGAVTLLEAHVVRLALRRRRIDLAPQDLIYSIGLMDYLADPLVSSVLGLIHDWLAPGGRTIIGNFHPRNPNRGVLDHVFRWPLIHRTESEMDHLFMHSRFGVPCSRTFFEPGGINLFAECQKA